GLYFEQLSDAEIYDIDMDHVGQYGRTLPFGGDGTFGAGIDINLKYGSYSGIDIHDFEFTDVGLSNKNGAGSSHAFGAGIVVKARNDGTDYSNPPATLDNVTIHNGTIDGTSTGIRIGEPTKANAGPTDVIVSNVEVTDAVAEYDNRTTSTLTVNIDTSDQNVSSNSDATGVIAYIDSTASSTTYTVNSGDTVTENSATGTDTVNARGSFTLGANVENLNLVDAGTGFDNFENFTLGTIDDGENGWTILAGGRDQAVVDLAGNHAFKMSSDPASGDFAGPYSPNIGVTAGEPASTSDGDVHIIKFRVKPVSSVADNSRLEVDTGTAQGTDRNNFMVIESIAGQGLRIAVADPLLNGDWDTDGDVNDFAAFTGNRTLIDGLDTTQWHDIELRVLYRDGADNDVIEVYVDGEKVGETTTFENYRDALGGTHAANAEANQTNRIFFRPGAGGAATDGPGGVNQGFYFDDITNTVTTNSTATGNGLANFINGNSGHNIIDGLDGADTIDGGAGKDTIDGGTGTDSINGGKGDDLIRETASDADVIDGGADMDTLQIDGTAADDTVVALYNGTKLTSINGGAISNIEAVTLSLAGNTAAGDTLSYATSSQAVTVNLGIGTASGFASIAGVENVVGSSGADHLIGDGNANVFTGGAGNDTIDGAGGTDTVIFSGNINDYAVQYDGNTQTYAVTHVGTSEIDSVKGVEKFSFNGTVFDVTGNPNLITNSFPPVFSSGTTSSFDENVANPTVYTAAATDADSAAVFGNIVYTLEGPDAGLFTINASTGVVKLIGSADFEADPGYSITVRATQGITSTTRAVTLSVNDLNDNNPVFQSGSTASVDENAANVAVYDANATDADTSFGNIVYSLEGANAAAFTINAGTGVVTLTGAADFETLPSYALTVRATQGTTSTTKAVTISVNNLNDQAPVFQSGTTASIAENTAASVVVYDANATDADSSATFGAIVYSLSGADASAFNIDAATGEVRLNSAANFEAKTGYAFGVTATQGSTATTQNVALAVTNVNEGVPGVLGTTTLTVESGSTKTPVGTVGTTAGTTFDVVSVSPGGGTVLNGTTVLAAGQTLTLAEANALTFSSGASSGSIQLLAHNGGADTTAVTVNLNVTAAVNATYTGTNSADRLDGAGGKDTILGKNGADILIGGAGKDTISGGSGKDTIYGGASKDVLTGGGSADQFVFDTTPKSSNVDTITDFQHGMDKIALDDAIFAAIGTSLTAKEFYASTSGKAHDKSDRIVYETDTGKLSYDADGNGAGKAIHFATLTGNPTVTLDDFLIV
ncbi:MAG: cadherin domain-containing protein, partial [Devosia sp.]